MANRVGSLYYEIGLNAGKFKKDSEKVKSESKVLNRILKKQGELDPKAHRARLKEQEVAAINHAISTGRMTVAQGNKAIREIHRHEKLVNSVRLAEAKAMAEKKAIIARTAASKDFDAQLKAQAAANAAKLQQEKAYNRKKNALNKKYRNIRHAEEVRSRPIERFKLVSKNLKSALSMVFPFALAIGAAAMAFGVLTRAMGKWIAAADKKTKSMIVLTTLLHGNREAADKLRNSLVSYAKATAFSVDQTMELAIQLKALGFAAGEIPGVLSKLGRLSFGDGGKLKLIAKAYSDVRAQGKLLMTEVRQFANQGVPLLAQLQKNLGMTALEVRDQMKKGLITFIDVKKAIDDIAESYGSVDTAALQTTTGQLEAAGEAWNEILASTGDFRVFQKMGVGLNVLLDSIGNVTNKTDDFKASLDSMMPSWVQLEAGVQLLEKLGYLLKYGVNAEKEWAADWLIGKINEQNKHLVEQGKIRDKLAERNAQAMVADEEFRNERLKNAQLIYDMNLKLRSLKGDKDATRILAEQAKHDATEVKVQTELVRLEEERMAIVKMSGAISDKERKKVHFNTNAAYDLIKRDTEQAIRAIAAEEEKVRLAKELTAEREKMLDLEKKLADKVSAQTARYDEEQTRIGNLSKDAAKPGEGTRQGSREEFAYLKQAEANKEIERRTQQRWNERTEENRQDALAVIDAIDALKLTQGI